MAIFLTVQPLDTGLLMLSTLHTILDPVRKQKTIMRIKEKAQIVIYAPVLK
jgi:hypothetical protein